MKALLAVIVLSSVFGLILEAIDQRTSNEVTVYRLICINKQVSMSDCKPPSSFVTATTFRVDFPSQIVIEKGFSPLALQHCVVFDRYNWRCNKGDDIVELQAGHYALFPPFGSHSAQDEIEISAIRYWLTQLQVMVSELSHKG